MSAIPSPGGNPPGGALARAILKGFDKVAKSVIDALQGLFGFQYARNIEHYVFQATITTGTADAIGTTYTSAFRITQDADFVCTRLNGSTRVASGTGLGGLVGTGGVVPAVGDFPDVPLTVLITEGGSDRQVSNEAVDFYMVYGSQGGLPGVFARPRLFARNSTVSLRLTSLKTVPASTTWAYRLAMIGWKIYDVSALNLTARA